jgi:hypothetical protein
MRKLIMLAMMAVLTMSLVHAQAPDCLALGYDAQKDGEVGDIDNECQDHGFDFGIAKWNYDGGFILSEEHDDYDTLVTGDSSSAHWESVPDADGVLSKEGVCYQYLPGGSSGDVDNIEYGISHVTLCGNEDGDNEIPEFTAIGAGIALLGAGAYFVSRKR